MLYRSLPILRSMVAGYMLLASFSVPFVRAHPFVRTTIEHRHTLFRASDDEPIYITREGKVTALHKHGMVTITTDDGNTYRVKGSGWKVGDAVLCDCFHNGRVSCGKVS